MKNIFYIYSIIASCLLLGFSPLSAQNFIYAKGLKNSTLQGGPVANTDVATDSLGNSYVLGTFSGIADFDPGADSSNLISAGKNDIFFAKYDKTGAFMYAKSIGGTESDAGSGMAVDSMGNLYIVGNFTGSIDFDPGIGTVNMNGNIFIAKYDPFGNFVYTKVIGSASVIDVGALALDALQNLYITGSFRGAVDFDPGSGIALESGSGLYRDVYFAKYDSSGNYLYVKALAGSTLHVGNADAIAVSDSSGIVIAGSFTGTIDFDPGGAAANLNTGGSVDDIFLARYDSLGNYRYARRFNGPDFDKPSDLAIDRHGNSYITGSFFFTIDFDPGNPGGNVTSFAGLDVFVAKHDSLGNFVYAKSIGGPGDDVSAGISVDSLSNAYVTGGFIGTVDFDPGVPVAELTSIGLSDIFVLKLDSTGQYVSANSMGGTGSDFGNSITVDAIGQVHAAGSFSDTADFDPGPGAALVNMEGRGLNGFIVVLTETGDYVWAAHQGHYSNQPLTDHSSQITIDSSGNIFITGAFYGSVDFDPGVNTAYLTSAGGSDIFVAKYDPLGNYIYAISMGGADFDRGHAIAIDQSGDVYVSGSFRGTVDMDPGAGIASLTSVNQYGVFIAKYDAAGNYVYSKALVGSGDILTYGIAVDNTNNLYITGSFVGTADFDPGTAINNLISAGGSDIFIARFDNGGNYVYAKTIGGTSPDIGRSIAIDALGNIHITGSFEGTADFDPGAGSASLTSAGSSDIFLAGYDVSGNFVYAKAFGGSFNDYGTGIVINTNGSLYLSGDFAGTVDFDAGAGVALLTSQGSSDIFVANYDNLGNYLFAKAIEGANTSGSLDIATDGKNNIYVSGLFFGTADFDPGIGVANHTSAGEQDIFIAKYDAAGNYIYSNAMGGTELDYGYGIVSDRSGNIYVSGSFQNTAEFNRAAPSANSMLASGNSGDIFFAKYGQSAALPVQFLTFSVKPTLSGDAVEINWSTAHEKDNSYFEIERSENGVKFEPVGRVNGCVDCIGVNLYTFFDRDPYRGVSYYRLKQVDIDGAFIYSRIQKVFLDDKPGSAIKLYPTITNGDFMLVITNHHESRQVVLQLFSEEGRLVQKRTSWIAQGNNTFHYSMAGLPQGIYLVTLTENNGTKIFTSKIIKK